MKSRPVALNEPALNNPEAVEIVPTEPRHSGRTLLATAVGKVAPVAHPLDPARSAAGVAEPTLLGAGLAQGQGDSSQRGINRRPGGHG